MSAFEELGVMPEIISSLEEMDWLLPTPVQTEAIPMILGGGDVAVAAETGSGKTGAFCVPILQIVYESRRTNLDSEAQSTAIDSAGDSSNESIKLSTIDRGRNVAVNSNGTIVQSRNRAVWDGVRATKAVARGKWYYVARLGDKGLGRVGWASRHASLILGTDARGFGYGGTAMKSFAGKFDPYGEKFGLDDRICCMVEYVKSSSLDESRIDVSFIKMGGAPKSLGTAFSVTYSEMGLANMSLYPALAMRNAELEVLFTSSCPIAEQLGFRPVCEARPEDATVPSDVEAMFKQAEASSNEGNGSYGNGDSSSASAEKNEKNPLAIIFEPSRELASQVEEEFHKFCNNLPTDTTRVCLLIGGGDVKRDRYLLKSGCDIVAGTLGSIVAQVKKGSLSLDSIRFFVLDEADTFATDNLADVEFLHKKVPVRNRVQTLLFSATLHSPEILQLSEKIQSFPTWIDLKGKESVPESVHHTMVRIDANVDDAYLKSVPPGISWPLDQVHQDNSESIEGDTVMEDASDERSQMIKKMKLGALLQVIDSYDMTQAMIFVRTQLDGDNVESFLLQCSNVDAQSVNVHRFRRRQTSGPQMKYSCALLHGGRRQQERNEALAAFKAGEVRFLICTDVAARGIDVVSLPYLINVTLPDKAENYIHRVGRVGRAERLGLAISLVAVQKELVWFHTCGKPRTGVCKRRSLVSTGGCLIWYNESKLFTEIEDRLKTRIEEFQTYVKRTKKNAGRTHYGGRAGDEKVDEEVDRQVMALQPAVQRLVQMEQDVQASFFALQREYPVS